MRVATGKVIDGRVVVEGTAFDEGAVVTILARDDDETFDLSPEQEAEVLIASLKQSVVKLSPLVSFSKNFAPPLEPAARA